ncbi:glycosyltransferase family 2 protein [Priestia sp. GS2]|uniref:glycosyltransferase family 2 protein n=1 Tax=Priestia sp. GS2 TaxID=3117403 RepID=UPI002ED9FA02
MLGLSVIIPIYNVEEYLAECLDSIVRSVKHSKNEANIDIVLVNDGTKDNSGKIAKRYSEKYNFKYVEKTNGGLGDARNFGLNYAQKEYVAFIDSDDKISEAFFSEIFNSLKTNPDLVIFDWYDYFEGEDNPEKIVKGIENQDYLWSVQPSAWNKVYRKSFFENIKFPIGKVYEDVGSIYKILSNVKTYSYIESPLYIYRKGRQNSLLTTINPKINDIYEVLENTYLYYADEIKNGNKVVEQGLAYQYVKLLMWSNMYRQLKFYKVKLWSFYKKMKYTRLLIYKRFPGWKEHEFIQKNSGFLKERFGKSYIYSIDKLGKSFFETNLILLAVIFRNIRRK